MAVKKKYDRNVLGRGLDDIGTGRGLDALIDTHSEVKTEGSSNLSEIDISQIEPNPNQPRREFDPEALGELATSIRELGIIQPITLRKVEGSKYQIIAGERRWRASQLAGLTKIPAYSGAKAAVTNFTQWLAVHFSKAGIRVNAIAPGFFATKQNAALLFNPDGTPTARTGKILAATPMGRFGDSEKELCGAVLFLLNNDAASFITGVTIPIDGGFSAYSGV
jgi:NAD(P)-dependent dehydrogenase (short-subunit alcohol dehydrogenase family)